MTPELVIQIVRQALTAAFWIAAPLLIVAFAGGILLSLVQILTSIQDSAFSSVPRLVLLLVTTLLVLPWMLARMTGYTAALLGDLTRYAR
jgi:flagellar biosynthetic protein FliQ